MAPDDSMSPTTDDQLQPPNTQQAQSSSGVSKRTAAKQAVRPLRRASVACVACRDRRIKCDGDSGQRGEPCSQCRQMKKRCVFRFDDRRKRSSSQAFLQHLQNRIAALEEDRERTSRNKGSENESLSISDFTQGSTDQRNKHLLECRIPDSNTALDHLPGMRMQQEPVLQVMLNKRSMSTDFGLLKSKALVQPQNHQSQICTRIAGSSNRMTDYKGSARSYLSADETGQLCYFGYTSNLQVMSLMPASSPEPSPPSPMDSRDQGLKELADSSGMKAHLLELYFTYQHPALEILDEDTFMADYAKGAKTKHFSNFLLYSILLRSIRLSDNPSVQEMARLYLHRAKSELLNELENPTIATVQALCIFGHYFGSLGNDRACWLYPGMAFRLLYDFGLHQDCSDLMNVGYLTENDRKCRLVTLWGCYILDKLYSGYQGRPTAVKLTDITAPLPTMETVGSQYQSLSAWVGLTTILDDILNVINGPEELLEQQSTLSQLSNTAGRLLEWFKALPPELQWNPKKDTLPSPGVCALHIQFLSTTILMHRPFAGYKASTESNKSPKRQLDGYSPALSRHICTQNATRISKLLLVFRRQYGVQKLFSIVVPIALTAAMSLISEISTEDQNAEKAEERKWLRVCLDTLNDLTPSFPVAGRNKRILTSILECCGYPELAQSDETRISTNPQAPPPQPKQQTIETVSRVESRNLATNVQIDLERVSEEGNGSDPHTMAISPIADYHDFEFPTFSPPQLLPSFNFGNWDGPFNLEVQNQVFQDLQQMDFTMNPEFTLDFPFT